MAKTSNSNQYDRLRLFVPPSYVSLLTSEITIDKNEKALLCHTDIDLVLNQQRLDDATIQSIISTWRSSSGVDTSRFSDEQLLNHIKSRHLQTPSELQSWLNYLTDMQQNIIDEERPKQEIESTPSQSDVVPSSEPGPSQNL